MQKKTIVCVYGKNGELETVFERLWGLYLTNFDKDFSYVALIDLPDAISYRVSGDAEIEEKAQYLTREMNRESGNAFFCAIRQRRFAGSMEKRYFACEEGEKGALKALWRFVKGKTAVLFPMFGKADISGAEQIYFSPQSMPSADGFIKLVQPSGIASLCSVSTPWDAVFPITGAMIGVSSHGNERVLEGLYGTQGLDKLLSCGHVDLKTATASDVGFVSYPAGSLKSFAKTKVFS